MDLENWEQWQSEVIALLRRDFEEAPWLISIHDIDWQLWRIYYLKGKSPRAAIERALERDL